MKFATKINFVPIVASALLISEITDTQTATKKSNAASANTAIDSHPTPSHSTDASSLQSFDTAAIAYQMMGLSKF